MPLPSFGATPLLATLSGTELIVVALALAALAVLVGSAVLGVLTRLRRGLTGEPEPPPPPGARRRRTRR